MLVIIYFLIIAFAVAQSMCAKRFSEENDNATVFNGFKALFALLLFAIMNIKGFKLHLPTLLYGGLYGFALSVSMYSGYKALSLGKMSLTTLFVSFSVLVPVLYGVLFSKEVLTIFRIFGIAFLLSALLVSNIKKEEKTKLSNKKWAFFVFLTFITNGFCSVLQKIHQTKFPGEYTNEFMLFAMALCAIVFTGSMLFKIKAYKHYNGKKYAVFAGITNGAANYLTLILAGYENALVLFPAISAGTMLLSIICGKALFKEKLATNQYIAIVCGIASVVLLKL